MNREKARNLLKKYQSMNENNCSTCKYLGLFLHKNSEEVSLVCRNFKYMSEKDHLGNTCGLWEKTEDKELF
jgi:hypothetical protein